MKTTKRALSTVALVLTSVASWGQQVTVQGMGTMTCGRFLEVRSTQAANYDFAVGQWVFGYLSAYNMESTSSVNNLPDQASALAFIEKYCREHPLDSVILASRALIKELKARGG